MNLSKDSIQLITGMMNHDATNRISLNNVFSHSWMIRHENECG